MNHRAACVTVVAAMLLASPLADASSAPPAIALTASPAHVDLTGTAMATVRLTNSGPDRVRVDVSRAGFSLDVRGRPKIVSVARERRSAAPWLMFRPRIVSLAPHRSAPVTIASVLPSHTEPGDHDALLLFTTRRRPHDGVAARMRLGVVVVVRAPGSVVHRLAFGSLRAVPAGRAHVLELVAANRGNVTESFGRSGAVVSIERAGRRLARLQAEPRELRPYTAGAFRFRYPRALGGRVTARVQLEPDSGHVVRRAFHLRL